MSEVELKPELRKPWTLVRDQRIRFLLVGGFNTVLGYSLFALFDFLIGDSLGEFGYMLALVLSYALAMTVAFFLHRKFVFRVKGKLLLDFGRFVLTNMVGFGLNAVILPLMVTITGLIPLIAQAITAFIVAIASYLLHKHFSFRRPENGNL
ncbi:MAG: GtrA family protein [Promicromonosporaceae bacterium]|nr:GtrA family protein [Promicromonosporaceae bacterium]